MTKEERKEYMKTWRKTHKKEISEYRKEYRKTHEKYNEASRNQNKKYYEAHREERKEYSKKYYEAHEEEIKEYHKEYHKKHYYKMKNEFHGLNISICLHNYYVRSKMYRYFSSFENYISFLINPDVKLKKSLLSHLCIVRDIDENDVLAAAGIQLTEEDKDYIREYEMRHCPRIK